MPDESTVQVAITPDDTSNDIKKAIEKKSGMPAPTQVLKQNGKELPEGKTAHDLGISDGDNLAGTLVCDCTRLGFKHSLRGLHCSNMAITTLLLRSLLIPTTHD